MRDVFRRRLALVSVAAIAALSMAAIAVPMASASRDQSPGSEDFHGKVVSTDQHPKTVKVDTTSRGTLSFRVNQQTRFEHIKGFSALTPGLKVEVHAKHGNGGWVAKKIDRRSSHSKL